MYFFWLFVACVPKKREVPTSALDRSFIDLVIPVLDLDKEPMPLEDSIIVAGTIEKEEWETLPEEVRMGLDALEVDFDALYPIVYKQDDDEYNSNRLLIEKKQEILDFGEHAVLFYEKDRHFEERCASAFYSGYAELRYREMVLHYSLPSHLSLLAKALLLDKLDKKGAPPQKGGVDLVARILNTYMKRGVKSVYADKSLTILAKYSPEEYTLPFEGAGVEDYVDVLNIESDMVYIPRFNWLKREEAEKIRTQLSNPNLKESILEKCTTLDEDSSVQLFCRGSNISNAMLGLYLDPEGVDDVVHVLAEDLNIIRAEIDGYWQVRLEKWVRSNNREAAAAVYKRNKSYLHLDQVPWIYETGVLESRSSLAKKEHAIGHIMRVKYNLRLLEDRLVSMPKTRSQRRRYIKTYPKRLRILMKEAEHVLHSYEDQNSYRKGMLLVMARVAFRYYNNSVYAYKGTSSHDEGTLDKERRNIYLLAQSLLRYLADQEDCSDICVEAKDLLKRL